MYRRLIVLAFVLSLVVATTGVAFAAAGRWANTQQVTLQPAIGHTSVLTLHPVYLVDTYVTCRLTHVDDYWYLSVGFCQSIKWSPARVGDWDNDPGFDDHQGFGVVKYDGGRYWATVENY